ncbi:MAG TPA: MGMT family protein [Sandaracinaceae bacterium]
MAIDPRDGIAIVLELSRPATQEDYDGADRSAGVGWALASAPPGLPWHRVVNARGGISAHRSPHVQRARLEAEGVRFGADGRLDLAVYGWKPRRARRP